MLAIVLSSLTSPCTICSSCHNCLRTFFLKKICAFSNAGVLKFYWANGPPDGAKHFPRTPSLSQHKFNHLGLIASSKMLLDSFILKHNTHNTLVFIEIGLNGHFIAYGQTGLCVEAVFKVFCCFFWSKVGLLSNKRVVTSHDIHLVCNCS